MKSRMTPVPRVAIAHDYLTQRGGAERVVLSLARQFPEAPIYTTLYEPTTTFPEFANLDVRVSPLNKVAFFRRRHRAALPLLPWVSGRMRVDAEVMLASSSAWAHGFGGAHRTLVYCYSPARFLYQADTYLSADAGRTKRAILCLLTPGLRRWDKRAAAGADRYLAISQVVRDRVHTTYGIDAPVVPAPVSRHLHAVPAEPVHHPVVEAGGFLLCVSRLLPYKNVDLVASAFSLLPQRQLVVVGRGPQWESLVAAAPPNVTYLRDLTDGQLRHVYEQSAGLVAASHEDFGLTPLEAAAFGKPSAVLQAGGFLDTMVPGETAIFFGSLDPRAIADAVEEMMATEWSPSALLDHVEKFSEDKFCAAVSAEVEALLSIKQGDK